MGLCFSSSSIVISEPPAPTIADLAVIDAFSAATVTLWDIFPEPRTFPGTTTMSPALVCLSILPTFTVGRLRVGRATSYATRFQILTSCFVDVFLSALISARVFGPLVRI